MDNDFLESLINLDGLNVDAEGDPCQRLAKIGDEIVDKLVEWTKQLPFYLDLAELSADVPTALLVKRWAELVLLSTVFYASCHQTAQEDQKIDITTVTNGESTTWLSLDDPKHNLSVLGKRLSLIMKRQVPQEYVEREAGALVEKFTELLQSFRRLGLSHEAYVCLKAVTLLHQGNLLNLARIYRFSGKFKNLFFF